MSDVKKLEATIKEQGEQISQLTQLSKAMVEQLKRTPAAGHSPQQVFGAPNIRTGESSMTSRGFSFAKMIGVLAGAIPHDQAKVEVNEIHGILHKAIASQPGMYDYKGVGHAGQTKFLAPLCMSYLPYDTIDSQMRRDIKAMVAAGSDGADLDEMKWIRTKQLQNAGYGQKTLSWLTETLGGALVAPPEFGELIELLRNKEACVNAGAKTVPLPPQGRMLYPRQTSASTTYWVGENQRIADSDVGTGEVTLQAKKLCVLIKSPNELLRFASPAAEALMRDDMTKSLALGLDLACLEGTGTDKSPQGLINKAAINRINSSTQGANGDTIIGQDLYRFIAAVEESNAEFEGFVMRPKTLYKYYQLRSAAVSAGDNAGPFLFNLIREAGDGVAVPLLAGYPVTKSTQVSQARIKGSATDLTYVVGGMWSDMLIGMFGAIEFATTAVGDTAFQYDQTWIRGILSADMAVRHEAAFVMMDNLNTTL